MFKSLRPLARGFARWKELDNSFLDPKLISKSKAEFDALPARQKVIYEADRKALIELARQRKTDNNLWWNRLSSMTEEEQELLPLPWIKKYGSQMHKIEENNLLNRFEENWNYEGRGKAIEHLDKLETNEAKEAFQR